MIGWLCLGLLLILAAAILTGIDLSPHLPTDLPGGLSGVATTIALVMAIALVEIVNRQGRVGVLRLVNSGLAGALALVAVATAFDDISATLTRHAGTVDAAAPQASAGTSHARTVEIRADRNGMFTTSAEIAGRTIPVLVDTGASLVVLTHEDAEEVNLRPAFLEYAVPLSTANGVVNGARVTLRDVSVGGIRVDDVDAVVLPRTVLAQSLLGQSYLNRIGHFERRGPVLILSE